MDETDDRIASLDNMGKKFDILFNEVKVKAHTPLYFTQYCSCILDIIEKKYNRNRVPLSAQDEELLEKLESTIRQGFELRGEQRYLDSILHSLDASVDQISLSNILLSTFEQPSSNEADLKKIRIHEGQLLMDSMLEKFDKAYYIASTQLAYDLMIQVIVRAVDSVTRVMEDMQQIFPNRNMGITTTIEELVEWVEHKHIFLRDAMVHVKPCKGIEGIEHLTRAKKLLRARAKRNRMLSKSLR